MNQAFDKAEEQTYDGVGEYEEQDICDDIYGRHGGLGVFSGEPRGECVAVDAADDYAADKAGELADLRYEALSEAREGSVEEHYQKEYNQSIRCHCKILSVI